MDVITYEELSTILRKIQGAPFAEMITETDLSDYQFTDSPFINRLKKVAKYTVQLGASYEEAMKGINPNFTIKDRKWGEHINNILIEHKGKLYVSCIIQKRHFSFLKVGKDKVTDEMEKQIKPYLKPLEEASNPVGYRRFKIYSIKQITFNNKSYMIL